MTTPDLASARRAYDALLAWWREAGVEPIAPLAPAPPRPVAAAPARPASRPAQPAPRPAPKVKLAAAPRADGDPMADARAAAARATSLEALKAALDRFERHPLRATARTTVFARGAARAPVMIIGEAPGQEEDEQGLPFVGRSGKLLDAIFAAAGLTDAAELYITNVVTWRPPANRSPSTEEIALLLPFLERHIALKAPRIIALAGAVAAQTVLASAQGITKLRGRWASYRVKGPDGAPHGPEIPALPIYHPAFLLRRPIAKREAWRDVLSLQDKLAELG